MLTIQRPEIVQRDNETVLQAELECAGMKDVLWFSVGKEYGEFLCHERGDAFLVAMLLYAMNRGEDIHVLAPISERLYYTLTKHLMKAITENFPGYHRIDIICDLDAGRLENAGGVATGFSCGIDSFFTVIEHTDELCPPNNRLTHLVFFNVGGSGDYGGDAARALFRSRAEAIQPCVNDLKLPLVTLDSNINEILSMNYMATSTYRIAAAALAMQKLFKTFYLSSGHSVLHFKVNPSDSGQYDAYLLNMLSTDETDFLSTGETYSRLEKTEIVSTFLPSYRYLNVCTSTVKNCSRCGKCKRTMVTLDVLGKLDLYSGVFDLRDYQKHRSQYFGSILSQRKHDDFRQEIYDAIELRGYRIPSVAHMYRYPISIFHFLCRNFPEFAKMMIRNVPKGLKRNFTTLK